MSTFADAVTVLMLNHPFYSQLLMKFKHVEDTSMPTAYVTPTTLGYNPDFLAKLDDDECVFVVAHEIQHAVLEHLPMMQFYHDSKLGPDGKDYNNDRMNRAMDYSVNGLLKEAGFKVPAESKIQLCLDLQKYPTTMTSEEIYCKMPADDSKSNQPKSMDEHRPEPANPADPPAITPTDIIAAAEHHRAVTGSYPGGIERLLADLKKPTNSPWKQLRALVLTAFPGVGRKTWRRLDRRMATRGIFIPGNTGLGSGRIGIVADTSGSIGQEVLNLFGGHMASIMDDARPRDVVVYWVDAKLHDQGTCRTPTELRAYLGKGAKGGGGTNMVVGVKAAVADKCDTIVVLTDGYTPFGEPEKTPVIWAITSDKVAPHGKTVHIN